MSKECRACKYRQHPSWAVLIPGFMICVHENAISGRLDVERSRKDGDGCGPDGKWWSSICG